MRSTEAVADALRASEICNACRYCEGYCAVFPAMELQRAFTKEDMAYFANLCHNCQSCFHACQFSPPHEFGINLPKTFAEIRNETYAEYAWPAGMGRVFERNGMLVSLAAAAAIAFVLIATIALHAPQSLTQARKGPGAFYAVIPWSAMSAIAGAAFLYALAAMTLGAIRFWRDTRSALTGNLTISALARALYDVFTLRYLGNDGEGCNDLDDGFAQVRRRLHHGVFYGFLLCFAATCVATVYDHVYGLAAPYPVFSLPVMLGTIGGAGMIVGTSGLVWVKIVADPQPRARRLLGGEYAFIGLLWLAAATGLALLALRETGAMAIALAIHLGAILALFLAMPYSRFVHGIYRATALLKAAVERAGRD